MAKLLSGAPVSQALSRRISAGVELLRERDVVPTMGIVRVGARPEDMAYESGPPSGPRPWAWRSAGPSCRRM